MNWLKSLSDWLRGRQGEVAVGDVASETGYVRQPYSGPERRRSEPHGVSAGDGWESNLQLRDCLLAAASRQAEEAKQKQQERWHWGEVGDIEATAVSDIRFNIENVPMNLTLQDYRAEMERRFDGLIEAYRRDDSSDPDGYGLGTLYAILRSAGWSL